MIDREIISLSEIYFGLTFGYAKIRITVNYRNFSYFLEGIFLKYPSMEIEAGRKELFKFFQIATKNHFERFLEGLELLLTLLII